MRKHRPNLIGVDFAQVLRKGAKDLMERAIKAGEKREREAAVYKYDTTQEIAVMVFEQRSNPPLWRMETLTELPYGIGTVTVYDETPRFLAAELRNVLADALAERRNDLDLDWLRNQKGMFSLLGIGPDRVAELCERRHIYMPPDSRINVAGVSRANVDRVADSLAPLIE